MSIHSLDRIVILESYFFENKVENLVNNTYGGCILVEYTRELYINHTYFNNGYSKTYGGALYVKNVVNTTIINTYVKFG